MRRVARQLVFWTALLLVAAGAATAWACSVPVFRYALERWRVDPYEVYVFHRGPLSDAQAKAVEALRAAESAEQGDGVVSLTVVDVASEPDADVAKVWQAHASEPLPRVVARFPEAFGIPIDAWAGPLGAESVAALLDSPARRQVARRLLENDSAVFVLLESGDRGADDAAARLLETELARLQETLELPAPPGGVWDDPVYDSQGAPSLKIALSVVRVARTDPAERAFIEMLLGIEPDLKTIREPMVFPLFGRGRALCALAGKGIEKRNIEEVCSFLAGPCSCIVKYENPGVDMLMRVDWDAALAGEASAIPEVRPPPLAGLAAFAPAAADGGSEAAEAQASPVSRLALVGVAGLVGVGIVAVAAIVIWRKGQAARD